MKKIYIILAAVAVGLFSFAGCTTSDNDTNSVTSEQSQSSKPTSDESTSSNDEQNSTSSESENTSDSKLTLSKVKDIIAENDDFQSILDEIGKIQEQPDSSGGSGITWVEYWLDESGSERIIIYDVGDLICYDTYDSEGNFIKEECLYDGSGITE